MKNRDARSALLVCLSMAFFCLLISGIPRLIARGQEEPMPLTRAVMHAAMIAAPANAAGQETCSGAQETPGQRTEKPAADTARIERTLPVLLRCDANGNVLGHRSYLHTVYRAFALGDGFV